VQETFLTSSQQHQISSLKFAFRVFVITILARHTYLLKLPEEAAYIKCLRLCPPQDARYLTVAAHGGRSESNLEITGRNICFCHKSHSRQKSQDILINDLQILQRRSISFPGKSKVLLV
jgi:hypothetical protein